MTCKRCGCDTPRLTLGQRYCPTCDREVKAILEVEARRAARPTFKARDLTDWAPR